MPRSRSSPHASSGSSHSYRSSQSSPAHPPQSTSNSRSSASKEHPPVTNVYLQRGGGPGLMGTIAASAGGAMLGHSLSNYLYGGNTAAPTQVAEAQTLAKEASAEGYVCAPQLNGYSLCLENNNNSTDQCKWAWDYFLQCQKSHASPQ